MRRAVSPPSGGPRGPGAAPRRRPVPLPERLAEGAIGLAGWLGIVLLALIPAYLLLESGRFLTAVGLRHFLLGPVWAPGAAPPRFGALPLLGATLLTTLVAMAVALPAGTLAALHLSEHLRGRAAGLARTALRAAAAVPPVVTGLVGRAYVAPALAAVLGLPDGRTALLAGICLGTAVLPTYTLLAAEGLRAVPRAAREAAVALGATPWEVSRHVVLRAAVPSLRAAAALAAGRAAGETMIVLLASGSQAGPPRLLGPVEPLSAAIAWEMGEAPAGSLHRQALFALGLVLLGMGLVFHLAAAAAASGDRR